MIDGQADLHPLVIEVAERQLRSLKVIFAVLAGLVLAILAVSLALGNPLGEEGLGGQLWLELALAGLSLVLLAVVLPLSRRRLLDPARVQQTDRATLAQIGLPDDVDLRIGRQAVYLTRYTAGCVVSWGLCAAVALYGLVARMLGSPALWSGLYFAAAVFCLVLLPPDKRKVWAALRGMRE